MIVIAIARLYGFIRFPYVRSVLVYVLFAVGRKGE